MDMVGASEGEREGRLLGSVLGKSELEEGLGGKVGEGSLGDTGAAVAVEVTGAGVNVTGAGVGVTGASVGVTGAGVGVMGADVVV
jgi:hypothetical protein